MFGMKTTQHCIQMPTTLPVVGIIHVPQLDADNILYFGIRDVHKGGRPLDHATLTTCAQKGCLS